MATDVLTPAEPSTDLGLLALEESALALPFFTADTAWTLGNLLRESLLKYSEPAVISISLANSSQLLFHAVTRPGTAPDNDVWVARKRKTVLRFGHSSWYMGKKFGGDEAAFAAKYGLGGDAGSYAIHGGGWPVRVKGVEGTVAVVVVSGLRQHQDHQAVVDALQELLRQMGLDIQELEKRKED